MTYAGFDEAEDEVALGFLFGAHAIIKSDTWWGNTRPMRQCDGTFVAGDGYPTYIRATD